MLTKLFCGLTGHRNLVRERNDDGHLCFRCENCLALLPNNMNRVTETPVEPNYNPAKAQLV